MKEFQSVTLKEFLRSVMCLTGYWMTTRVNRIPERDDDLFLASIAHQVADDRHEHRRLPGRRGAKNEYRMPPDIPQHLRHRKIVSG